MARPTVVPDAAQMAERLRRMSTYLLVGAVVLVLAGVVLLARGERTVVGVALIVLGGVDVALALTVRRQAARTVAGPPASETQETR